MPRQIRTLQGDTVDLIALRGYGDTAMTVAILNANPGLADRVVLPAGLLVTLPDQAPPTTAPLTLW